MASQRDVLKTLGLPSTRAFQAAWNLGSRLQVDGIWGPKTTAAGNLSLRRHQLRKPDISAHFSCWEFACRCGGSKDGCQGVLIYRTLLESLETLRGRTGPLRIVSGYRCAAHNAAVGGARASQHLVGAAADIPPQLTLNQVKALKVFSGIGYVRATGMVVHVDRRTTASCTNPAVWPY